MGSPKIQKSKMICSDLPNLFEIEKKTLIFFEIGKYLEVTQRAWNLALISYGGNAIFRFDIKSSKITNSKEPCHILRSVSKHYSFV